MADEQVSSSIREGAATRRPAAQRLPALEMSPLNSEQSTPTEGKLRSLDISASGVLVSKNGQVHGAGRIFPYRTRSNNMDESIWNTCVVDAAAQPTRFGRVRARRDSS